MLIRQLPPDCALRRSVDPDGWGWGISEHLLASAVDVLNAANWQRSGGKATRPKPVPRPGARGRTVQGRSSRSAAERDRYLRSVGPVS